MPRKRDPLKRLTRSELFALESLLYDIRAAYRKLGGRIGKCGHVSCRNGAGCAMESERG